MKDSVLIDEARYQRQEEERARADAEITQIARDLMGEGEECDPFSEQNIVEALGEMDEVDRLLLSQYLRGDETGKIGQRIKSICRDYWQADAEAQAEAIYNEREKNRG